MPTDAIHDCDAAHVVILGASNVTLGFPRIVAEIRRQFPGRLQIFAAHGHGRSYGRPSWAPFRTLPGLRQCGLWDAFRAARDQAQQAGQAPPLYALATDLGNDLLFGATPDQIDEWLRECLAPLKREGAVLTVGRPPVFALQRIGRTRFKATRSFFFPNSPLTYERMLSDVPRLDELIVARAQELGATPFAPRPEWYGFDPIHIRRPWRTAAWREIIGLWSAADASPRSLLNVAPRRRDWLLRAADRRVFGARRQTPQPAFRWNDGGAIWLY
ncbi:hypothetical protein Pan44_21610 [Caulifigura coniformis]|uniref:SGNH hydrolase-type esterase domain-containing protein n=2 Tax=Caulifigura coniformis TaxID=2527983 RepID=A0A517SDD0_9PLAN|nr:hypothetical protein Pan44_21610 [Caulifigura coniformis]